MFRLILTAALALQVPVCLAAPVMADAGHTLAARVQLLADTSPTATNVTTSDTPMPIAQPPAGDNERLPFDVNSPDESPVGNNERLPLNLVNNFAGTDTINAYVTGLNSENHVVFLQSNGEWHYPTTTTTTSDSTASNEPQLVTADVAIPVGNGNSAGGNSSSTANRITPLTLPGYLSGGRIWFVRGNLDFFTVAGKDGITLVEPSVVNPSDSSVNVEWDFVELTTDAADGVTADISFVDFVGLPLGITLEGINSNESQSIQGLTDSLEDICDELRQQACADGQPWDQLCVTTNSTTDSRTLRILSPTDYLVQNPNAFDGYFEGYVGQVWQYYASHTLVTDGGVSCSVTGSELTCDGDNRGYARPTTTDIFGCNTGPFEIAASDNDIHKAVVPWLCASFNRHTLLANETRSASRNSTQPASGNSTQPASGNSLGYFTQSPNNWYSSIIHRHEAGGKGYAFSYDDVPVNGVDLSGLVQSPNPATLTVTIG